MIEIDRPMTEKDIRYHRLYIDIAKRVSQMSYARRRQVGCVIVKDGNIISMGWNGMPSGMSNECEHWVEDGDNGSGWVTNPEVSHAEENAIAKLARSNMSSAGATAYVTLEPCLHCAKLLYSACIKRVFILEKYRNSDGTDYLNRCGVEVTFL